MNLEVAADPDCVHESLKTQVSDDRILCLIEDNAEDREICRPSILEHGSDSRDIFDQYKSIVLMVLLQHCRSSAQYALPLLVEQEFLVGAGGGFELHSGVLVLFEGEGLSDNRIEYIFQEYVEVYGAAVAQLDPCGDLAEVG